MFEIGATLREARSRAGLELKDVESATMIPARYLEALERERFELLPAGMYRRSFLREYAEFLGLGGDIYAAEYDLRVAPPEPEPADTIDRSPGRGSVRVFGGRSRAWLAAAALAALVGIAVWQLGGSHGTDTVTPPPTTAPAPAPAPTRPRVRHTAKPRHRATPARASAARARILELTAARGDCWLSVRIGSDTGPVVYEHILQQGGTLRFGLRKALWIRIGAPSNLDASIGHRSVSSALPTNTGDVIATSAGLANPVSTRTTSATVSTSTTSATVSTSSSPVVGAVAANTRGYELMLSGNYSAALPYLRRAVAALTDANPVTAYANFNLGQTLVALRQCGEAIPYLQRAAELEPTRQQVHAALDDARRCSR